MTVEGDAVGDADKVDEVVSALQVGINHVGESAAQSQGEYPCLFTQCIPGYLQDAINKIQW